MELKFSNYKKEVFVGASIKQTVIASDEEAQYDEKAKKLLGHKIILAYILVNTIDEFRGMNPKDVVKYIEGEPHINVVPIDPGVTNTSEKTETESIKDRKIPEQVIGLNTENSEINEGMVRFDIIFYVRMKNGLNQIIINIEAQKEEPSKYKILNRAVFYICRIISSQKGRDFVKSEYNKMKKVYSIWICMNMKENSLTHIHLSEDDIIGSHNWKGDLELLNIIMIGIAENPPSKEDEKYTLHRLLSTILSSNLKVNEKLQIIETEYNIQIEDSIREDVEEMCNLSQGIKEKAFEGGYTEGYSKAILRMYEAGLPIEQIATIMKESVENIKKCYSNLQQLNSEFLILLQQPKSASKGRRYPIFVPLEQGLNASMEGEHSNRK